MDIEVMERVEAESLFQLENGAPESVRSGLGITAAHVAGGVLVAMRHDPVPLWSRAIGFGFDEPVTAGLLAELVDFHREHGSAVAIFQLAPAVLPDDWADIATAAGLRPGAHWVKLAHDLTRLPDADTDLRVTTVDAGSAAEWAVTLLRGFESAGKGLEEMFAATVHTPGFRLYAAWDGDDLVAAAMTYRRADVVHMSGAATLPSHRNRGAQSALLARRLADARAEGCTLAVAETGKEAPGQHNDSLRNMHRCGFRTLYARRNWLWRPEP